MLAEGRFQGLIQEEVSWLSLNSGVHGRGRAGDPVGFPQCSLNTLCLSPTERSLRYDLLGNPLSMCVVYVFTQVMFVHVQAKDVRVLWVTSSDCPGLAL